jgi:hypothetical protein
MTDRYNSLIVVLEKDIRDDDAESTIEAIKHIKGVLRVKGNVVDTSDFVARSRVKTELLEKILDILK